MTQTQGGESGEVVDRLNEAADLIHDDPHCDQLTRAVGVWLRGEAATQQAMEPLLNVFNLAVEHVGGPKSYLRLGQLTDGSPRMESDTNEAAVQVANEVLRRYGKWQLAT